MAKQAHQLASKSVTFNTIGIVCFHRLDRVYTFALVIAGLLLAGGYFFVPLATAATTGQVTITGNVPIACDLLVQQEAGADNIPDISAGHTNRHVATVTETCNSPDGYTVTLTGANSSDHTGMFVDIVSTDSHPFTISYNGISVPPGGLVTDSTVPTFGVQKNVDITYPADETLSGTVTNTYEETLTFTISAK
ncbi:MAG: hypothetical protein HY080_08135 [Gammaproteobacteria bacterium]|nr:hypothetical protein [Gammaproteobacteria bacterium]